MGNLTIICYRSKSECGNYEESTGLCMRYVDACDRIHRKDYLADDNDESQCAERTPCLPDCSVWPVGNRDV